VTSRSRQKQTFKPASSQEEMGEEPVQETDLPSVYSCPQEGCVRVFQRSAALERHLSLESCSNTLERQTMLDLAKERYASLLQEDVGVIPSIRIPSTTQNDESQPSLQEGWALKETRKMYR